MLCTVKLLQTALDVTSHKVINVLFVIQHVYMYVFMYVCVYIYQYIHTHTHTYTKSILIYYYILTVFVCVFHLFHPSVDLTGSLKRISLFMNQTPFLRLGARDVL